MALVFTAFSAMPKMPLAPAFAGDEMRKISLFVLPASPSEIDTARLINRLMRQWADKLTGVELVTPAPLPDRRASLFVTNRIQDIYQLVNNHQTDDAVNSFLEIDDDFHSALPGLSLKSVATYFKAFAVTQSILGNRDEARTALLTSLNLWPEQSNLEYVYSKEVLELFSMTQQEINTMQSGKLSVVTEPAQAVVYIDSKDPIQTPAVISNLNQGTHLVKIVKDGYLQYAKLVHVSSGTTTHEVKLELIPDFNEFQKRLSKTDGTQGSAPEETSKALEELKELMGVDDILFIWASVIGQAYELKGVHLNRDNRSTPVSRVIDKDAEFYAALKEFLSGSFEAYFGLRQASEGLAGPPIDPSILKEAGVATETATGLFDPDNPIFPDVQFEKKKEKSIMDEWWFWTGIGVVVSAGIGGGAWLLTGGGGAAGPEGVLEINLR